MKYIIRAKSVSTSVGIYSEGNVVDIPETEVAKIHKMKPGTFEAVEDTIVFKAASKKSPTKKKRARNKNGTLKADDPNTPDINEAFEQ